MVKPLESRKGKARVSAMQFFYEIENQKVDDLDESLKNHFEFTGVKSGSRKYAELLIRGCQERLTEIDELISKCLQNWDLKRLTLIDKIILRIGIYEMLHVEEVPPKVTVNEMIEIAKQYSKTDSSGFINGILDKILHTKVGKEDG